MNLIGILVLFVASLPGSMLLLGVPEGLLPEGDAAGYVLQFVVNVVCIAPFYFWWLRSGRRPSRAEADAPAA